MNNEVKNQHFVPRFYLSNFAQKNKIFVFDKINNKVFPTNIEKIACKHFFYDIPKIIAYENDKQVVEKRLAKLEEINAQVLKEFINEIETKSTITNLLKVKLSFFLNIQFYRIEYFRNYLIFSNKKKNDNKQIKIYKLNNKNKIEKKIKIYEDLLSYKHAKFFLDHDLIDDFSKTLYTHIWIIGFNNTQKIYIHQIIL